MKIKIFIILSFPLLFSQCSKVLDKTDLAAVNEGDVWNDVKLATAYVNKLYEDNLPGWDAGMASNSDEARGNSDILYGQLTINSINFWPYARIRNINILLKNIDGGTLDEPTRNVLKGQAYFLRAMCYFEMVRLYGGVPLILEPQEIEDDLNVSRNKTSECIAQIYSDLDFAASLLPPVWGGNDIGRISAGAARAYKGRVALYYASPQFNPSGLADRWQTAYEINKDAKQALESAGYGLYESFSDLWFKEMNKEVVLVRRYEYPASVNSWNAASRPIEEAQNANGSNQPTLEMLRSFPMKSGKPIDDAGSGYDATHYWLNRDPRFNATIAYNGVLWELSGKAGRKQWTYVGSEPQLPTPTGFYCRKAVDVSYTPFYTSQSSTDWVELRFAEVLLNLAESANEVGKTDEAYAELKTLRQRAGIEPGGDGMYGLKAGMGIPEMTETIMNERKIELAYEAKRYWDLRRRRAFASELNGTKRHGLIITLKIPFDGFLAIRDTVNLNITYQNYFLDSEASVDDTYSINFRDAYYFFAIPLTHLEQNSKLEQTIGWDGGTFDPLQ